MRSSLLVLLLVAAAACACRDLEVVTASYATLAEARQAGAIERGRLPRGLPPGAHDIREAFDLDTNRRWGLFGFPVTEAEHLRALLEPGEFPLDGQQVDIPRRIEWWPVLLRGRLDPERIQTTGLRGHRTRDRSLVFAVNWQQGRAYYWSVSH